MVRATGIPSWVFQIVWVPVCVACAVLLAIRDSPTFPAIALAGLLPFPPFSKRSRRKPEATES
jgi:hypothetical protein